MTADPRKTARRLAWLVASLAVLGVAGWLVAPRVRSAALLLDLMGSTSWARRILPVRPAAVTWRDVTIPTRRGPVAARVYEPAGGSPRSAIVFPGIHGGGVDEPRLTAFSSRLAASGVVVLSVPIPDLRAYRITPDSTDVIEDATGWMAADRTLAPAGRVTVIGISFSGGLAVVAAARPSLAGKIQMVVSIGGHADLPRTMIYLCTGNVAGSSPPPPHDYGAAIILRAAVDRLVAPADANALRHAVVTFLEASSAESTDRSKAAQLFADAAREGDALVEPGRTLMSWVISRNVRALGARLVPFIEELGGAAALSPDRSAAPQVPVFLLHGEADNVIPSSETPHLAAYLHDHGNARVEWLLTPLLSHADVTTGASAGDTWRLVSFWTRLLAASSAP